MAKVIFAQREQFASAVAAVLRRRHCTRSSRQQRQRFGVPRPHDREVPMVESGDIGLTQSFGKRDNARVDHAQLEVVVLLLQRTAALEVCCGCWLAPVRASEDIVLECQPRLDGQPFVAPVVNLGKHQKRDNEVAIDSL
jgi:hypothetical protein